MLAALLEAMRPHQWIKNLLVFASLVFARRLGDPVAIGRAAAAFVVFCLVASAIYLINDLVDRDRDAQHPTKRNRPIPSGRLSPGQARGAAGALLVAAAAIGFALGKAGPASTHFLIWPGAYFALNLAYSLRLKQVVILDCICIAVGFQLRVHAGSVAIGEPSSKWLLLCTLFVALFLAFCKRRAERAHVDDADGGSTRATMRDYTLPFLDQIIAPTAALSILSYSLYTVAEQTVAKHGENLVFTVPFVAFGVFRYLFLVHGSAKAEDPARLLVTDRQLVGSGLLWALAVVWALTAR